MASNSYLLWDASVISEKPVSRLNKFCNKVLIYILSFLLTFNPLLVDLNIMSSASAATQIEVLPGQETRLGTAQNGVPVVEIANPTAGGVSYNAYKKHNVGPEGVIMNNSLTVGQSQLGGMLGANRNFTSGREASVIISEVKNAGGSQSRLEGYTEIFGGKASYFFLDPNGIACNGCGFINTSRLGLITGS